MVNIDYIMDLLDWNNSIEKQEQGIKLAKEVKCINVFLQPGSHYCGLQSRNVIYGVASQSGSIRFMP